ncbi:hypothetical protein [Pleurocapsa sp. PCC 7319]|uniref:hypothetical protein n=1 Tax=Pleurocapsa sp. PCC 7319 TaxID=118161 RepID=UPI00037638F4|nr:hypothetical protein [Pleurocapsa sp. PCC 7319]
MKRVLVIAISMIATLGISSPLLAQEKVTINSREARNVVKINPYNLVTGSYQGRFIDQGIPSGGRFLAAVKSKKIDAHDLVETAVSAGRLSEDTLNDKSYLSHVKSMLNNLDKN